VLACRGSEGCVSLLKEDEKANAEVVGNVNGKGMVETLSSASRSQGMAG